MEMKKLKNSMAALLAVVLALTLSACSFNPFGLFKGGEESSQTQEELEEKPKKSLYDQGLEVISLMQEMAGNEEYLRIVGASEELAEIAQNFASGAGTAPAMAYKITFSGKSINQVFGLLTGGESVDIPSELEDTLRTRTFSSFATMINSYFCGNQVLAASSLCTAGKTFVDSSLTENTLYLYRYDDLKIPPVAVTFVLGEGGAVSASGTFIGTTDIFSFEEEFQSMVKELGLQIEEIQP